MVKLHSCVQFVTQEAAIIGALLPMSTAYALHASTPAGPQLWFGTASMEGRRILT